MREIFPPVTSCNKTLGELLDADLQDPVKLTVFNYFFFFPSHEPYYEVFTLIH